MQLSYFFTFSHICLCYTIMDYFYLINYLYYNYLLLCSYILLLYFNKNYCIYSSPFLYLPINNQYYCSYFSFNIYVFFSYSLMLLFNYIFELYSLMPFYAFVECSSLFVFNYSNLQFPPIYIFQSFMLLSSSYLLSALFSPYSIFYFFCRLKLLFL